MGAREVIPWIGKFAVKYEDLSPRKTSVETDKLILKFIKMQSVVKQQNKFA